MGKVLLITIRVKGLILLIKSFRTAFTWERSILPFLSIGVPTEIIIRSEFFIARSVVVENSISFRG